MVDVVPPRLHTEVESVHRDEADQSGYSDSYGDDGDLLDLRERDGVGSERRERFRDIVGFHCVPFRWLTGVTIGPV